MTIRMPSAAQASSAAGVVALIGSATAMMPAGSSVDGDEQAVAPSRRSASALRLELAECHAEVAHQLGIAERHGRPSTVPVTPLPVTERKSVDILAARCRALAPPRRSRRPADVRSTAPGSRPSDRTLGLVEARSGNDRDHPRLAFGQRAGLVDDQRVDLLEPLQRLGVLDRARRRSRPCRRRP